ncbi:hypothetical protein ACNHKD_12245 [Methylocystis sp. JAN1]|uniref:hypothetical protein n=1 Tax=Methylocystis sp. JAN1 TaxID=3397211 RepID=UPI003FA33A3C
MSVAHDRDFDGLAAAPEIAAEASSDALRAPSYDELWGRPKRPVAQGLPEPKRDRSPIFATIVAIIVGATALIALRERIVRAFPPMSTAYRAMAMPVNLAGLELRDVHSRIVMDGARKVLVTEGEIVNIRRESNRVPSISLAIRGANGLDRYGWTVPTPKSRLEAGEKIAFRARLASPPEDGAEVLVRFAKLEESKPAPPSFKSVSKR